MIQFLVKIRNKLNLHRIDISQSRNLTLLGRVLITKFLGISELFYSISILDTPSEYMKATNSLLFKFIWKKKEDKIKRKIMSLDYSH